MSARFESPPGSIPTLPVPDLSAWARVHFVGIGGAGMSGIARLLLARGIAVSGSDLKDSRGLEGLRSAGATVFVGHRAEQLADADAIVVSSAIPSTNVELAEASRRGIPVLMRAQVLGALMNGTDGVAVAGTHGKTTTTSMISVVLSKTGRSPTFVIGGDLNESGSGAEPGTGTTFVAEADESDGTFLLLRPAVAVITNVEPDHLEFYGDLERLEAAFAEFAATAPLVVACWDDPGVRRSLGSLPDGPNVIRYGTNAGDDVEVLVAETSSERGEASARVVVRGTPVDLRLRVPGRHNLLNAAAALAVADALGVPPGEAAAALGEFTGVRRRFDVRGSAGGAVFVDDYAHHPTEVVATLTAAAERRSARLLAVFQPHRYTRTESMWRAMGESLRQADVVVVTDVYGAGENPIPGVTGKLVVDALVDAAPGKRVIYLPRRSDVAPFLAGTIRPGDLVLTLGAGDITMVGEETLERVREGS